MNLKIVMQFHRINIIEMMPNGYARIEINTYLQLNDVKTSDTRELLKSLLSFAAQ